MEVWLKFLREFNGRSFFLDDKWNTSPPLELYTDAAGSKGYGAIFGPHWFFGSFTDQWQSFNITFLELFPIALSVRIWGSQMANRCIVFVTDNAALVSIINQQTSKHKLVMILIRDLVLTALNYRISSIKPPPLSNKPPLFRGGKLIRSPSLLSPPPLPPRPILILHKKINH